MLGRHRPVHELPSAARIAVGLKWMSLSDDIAVQELLVVDRPTAKRPHSSSYSVPLTSKSDGEHKKDEFSKIHSHSQAPEHL